MRLMSAVLLVGFLCGMGYAQEETVAPAIPYSHELYIHPFSLVLGTATEGLPTMLYLTYEKPMGPGKAFIATGDMIFGNLLVEEIDIFGFDIGPGIRKYLSKPASGLYLQAKGAFSYASISENVSGSDVTATAIGGSALGYIGVKGQYNRIGIFTDLGIGYQFGSVSTTGGSFTQDVEGSLTGVAWDLNVGLGYGF